MSYAIDRMRAVSLERQEDVWSLEVEELIRINRNTFRPRRRRLTGKEVILQHLAVNQGALVGPTRQLLDGSQVPSQGARYEIRGAGWVPAPRMEPVVDEASPDRARAAAATESQLNQLAKRIRELEETLRAVTARLEKAEAALASGAVPTATDKGVVDVATAATQVGTSVDQMGSAQAESSPEVPAPETPSFPALRVPAHDAILDLVRGLVGDSVRMSKADPSAFVMAPGTKGYLSCLRSDAGEVVAALVMNMEATIRLAGGMLMEAVDELDAQVEDGTPSDDVLDAAGEVLNTLTSAVNKTSGNAHVRAGALETLEATEQDWLAKPRAREDFQFSVGGRLAVLCR